MELESIPGVATIAHQKMRLARNPIVHKLAALAATDRSVLRYFLDVMVPEEYLSATYKKLLSLEASERPAKVIGGVTLLDGAYFWVDDSLNRFLQFNRPGFRQASITECPLTTAPFQLVERRQPENTEVTKPVEYALKAGLSFEEFPYYGENFFDTYLDSSLRFLTWQPNEKLVDAGQQEYLYFLVNFTPLPTVLRLWAQVTFTDGTSTIIDRMEKNTIRPYQVYRMPAGHKELGLGLLDKPVKKWSVFLTNQDNERVSELRTYYLDPKYRRNVHYFLFNNSLGGFDTVRFTGSWTESLATTRELIEKYLREDYQVADRETDTNAIEGEDSITVFTGWLRPKYRDYLRELFLASELYRIRSSDFLSVRLDGKEWLARNPDDPLSGAKLKFVANHTVRTYSRMPAYLPGPDLYYNLEITGSVARNDCPTGQVGGSVTYTVPAGVFSSPDSQEDAQAQAQAYFEANKQAYANANGTCTLPLFYNTEISAQVRKNDCSGGVGSLVPYTVAAGAFSSSVDQPTAQALAQAYFDANKQAYANENGVCTIIHVQSENRNETISYPDAFGGIDHDYEYWLVFKDALGNPLEVVGLVVNYHKHLNDVSTSYDVDDSTVPISGVTEYFLGNGAQHASYDSSGTENYNYRTDYNILPGTGYFTP
jgi:hypothetical protein